MIHEIFQVDAMKRRPLKPSKVQLRDRHCIHHSLFNCVDSHKIHQDPTSASTGLLFSICHNSHLYIAVFWWALGGFKAHGGMGFF